MAEVRKLHPKTCIKNFKLSIWTLCKTLEDGLSILAIAIKKESGKFRDLQRFELNTWNDLTLVSGKMLKINGPQIS